MPTRDEMTVSHLEEDTSYVTVYAKKEYEFQYIQQWCIVGLEGCIECGRGRGGPEELS